MVRLTIWVARQLTEHRKFESYPTGREGLELYAMVYAGSIESAGTHGGMSCSAL